MESGIYIPGQMVTVFLVTEKIRTPDHIDTEGLDRFERIEKLNKYHMSFYKTFWKKSVDPRYFVAQTVSDDRGVFEFVNVEPGEYYILVTFPTIIGGIKVAWQVPVIMKPSIDTHVTLSNENLVLPGYSRYSTLQWCRAGGEKMVSGIRKQISGYPM
jgi:hypothetical protein